MAEFGALSSLGLGSNVLNYDIIDKLRKVDEDGQVKPIEKQLETIKKREEDLAKITTMAASLKSTLFDLSDSTLFAKRTVEVTGEDIEVSAEDGTEAQNFDIVVKELARSDIKQTKGFASDSTVVTTVDTDMTITIGSQPTTFTVPAGTTLKELKELIDEKMGDRVNTTLLNTGGENPFRLVLKTAETGADQTMTFSFDDGDAGTADDDFLALTAPEASVQEARDALFTFNGIDITRSSNTVDDLVVGMTLTLKNESDNVNRVAIAQDNEGIAEQIQGFVDQYNELMGNLQAATRYDAENKTAGLFQGDSTVVSLKLSISRIALGSAPNGKALADFGLDVTRDGVMSFDSAKLTAALKNDTEAVMETFAGSEEKPGVFLALKEYLNDAATSRNSMLKNLDTQLKDRQDRLEEKKDRALQSIEAKYQIMAKKFAAYDEMISKFNSAFQSLQSMIDAQNAAANK